MVFTGDNRDGNNNHPPSLIAPLQPSVLSVTHPVEDRGRVSG